MTASDNINKRQFTTVLGEKLKVMRYHPEGDEGENLDYSHKTMDNYGIQSATGGLREITGPNGEYLGEGMNIKDSVRIIQEHRNRNTPTP